MEKLYTHQINNRKIAYHFYDNGCASTLFLFHGFGQCKLVFEPYISTFSAYYNIITIDLFFHGDSIIDQFAIDFITVKEWNSLFQQILIKHSVHVFSVLGYSMGARFILSIMKECANRIQKIVLIAPDGFENNFWFRAATSTKLSRSIFKFVLKNPFILNYSIRFLALIGIYNSHTKGFMLRTLESKQLVDKMYISWIYFRKLILTKKEFIEIIKQEHIGLLCCCSKNDQMVSKKTIEKICKETKSKCIVSDISHQKMLQLINDPEVQEFLISDR